MSKLQQKQAVVSLCLQTYAAKNKGDYELNGSTIMSEALSDTDKASIRESLFKMSRAGEISYKPDFIANKLNDDSELKKYISGLLNNHLRKTPEFNGGAKYKAKNPGSRAHVGDAKLTALKRLASTMTQGQEGWDDVMSEIVKRKAEIEASKAKPRDSRPRCAPTAACGAIAPPTARAMPPRTCACRPPPG